MTAPIHTAADALDRRRFVAQCTAAGAAAAVMFCPNARAHAQSSAAAPDIPRPNPIGVSTYSFWRFKDDSRLSVEQCIDEAARIVPLEDLCLSPQCGFSSTHHGNALTEADQWRKLELVVEVAREVWG